MHSYHFTRMKLHIVYYCIVLIRMYCVVLIRIELLNVLQKDLLMPIFKN